MGNTSTKINLDGNTSGRVLVKTTPVNEPLDGTSDGFVHGEAAKKTREKNKEYIFESTPDINTRPGMFDLTFPPTGIKVVSDSQSYGFCISCSAEVHVLQLLEINIAENTFTVRLEVAAHWICPMKDARDYEGFYAAFKPKVILDNRRGTHGAIGQDVFEDSEIERFTIRPRRKDGNILKKDGKIDVMTRAMLSHFVVRSKTTAELRQAFELVNFPFDNQVSLQKH
jgi:hypothetical protein